MYMHVHKHTHTHTHTQVVEGLESIVAGESRLSSRLSSSLSFAAAAALFISARCSMYTDCVCALLRSFISARSCVCVCVCVCVCACECVCV